MSGNADYIRSKLTDIVGNSVAAANYDFEVSAAAGKNNVIEYFYFVDVNGDQVEATGGSVEIQFSSGANIFQTIDQGSFTVENARLGSRGKSNGYGRVEVVRVIITGTVLGATGFRALFTQNA